MKKQTKGIKDKYVVEIYGLNPDRAALYDAINKRVDTMFRKGLVREVKSLLRRKLSITARQALGVKEAEGYLNGSYGLDRAKELLKRNTRRFAKRQLTWFKGDKRVKWLSA